MIKNDKKIVLYITYAHDTMNCVNIIGKEMK